MANQKNNNKKKKKKKKGQKEEEEAKNQRKSEKERLTRCSISDGLIGIVRFIIGDDKKV